MPDHITTPLPSAGGLRERKKLQTRNDIAMAATDLVAEHGMDGTTVEMIAERAEISPRTFFNYFTTKAEAVLALTVDTFAALPELLDARPATENPLVAIRETFCRFAHVTQLADGRDSQMRAILEANPVLKAELDRAFAALGDQLTHQLIARHPDDPDAPTAAAAAVTMGFGLLWLAYVDADSSPGNGLSAARLREYFDVFLHYPFTG